MNEMKFYFLVYFQSTIHSFTHVADLKVQKDVIRYTAAAAAKSLQLCPTLSDPIDGSPPGSSFHGIFQARLLEWVTIAFFDMWPTKPKIVTGPLQKNFAAH